jgi:hypothetical protein
MPKAPSLEAFNAWLDHPVSQMVFIALQNMAEEQQKEWLERSWQNGQSNPVLLTELRTRADAYQAMADTNYYGFCDAAQMEPVDK